MGTYVKTAFTMALCGTVSWTLVGCATYYVPTVGKSVALGTVGVVSAKFVPEADIEMPSTGLKGHAIGRWEGLKGGVKKGGEAGAVGGAAVGMGCIVTGMFFAPCALATIISGGILGVVGGGAVGIVSNPEGIPSEEEVEQSKNIIQQLIAELHMQDSFRKQVLALARERTTYSLIEEVEIGPKHADEELSYKPLQERGIDTVLELSVLSLGMEGETGLDPELTLSVTVNGRLMRLADGFTIKNTSFTQKSNPNVYSSWAANRGYAFQKVLDGAYEELGSKITSDFLQAALR